MLKCNELPLCHFPANLTMKNNPEGFTYYYYLQCLSIRLIIGFHVWNLI